MVTTLYKTANSELLNASIQLKMRTSEQPGFTDTVVYMYQQTNCILVY